MPYFAGLLVQAGLSWQLHRAPRLESRLGDELAATDATSRAPRFTWPTHPGRGAARHRAPAHPQRPGQPALRAAQRPRAAPRPLGRYDNQAPASASHLRLSQLTPGCLRLSHLGLSQLRPADGHRPGQLWAASTCWC